MQEEAHECRPADSPVAPVNACFQQFGPALEAVTDRDSEQDYAGNHQLLVPGQLISQETFRGR